MGDEEKRQQVLLFGGNGNNAEANDSSDHQKTYNINDVVKNRAVKRIKLQNEASIIEDKIAEGNLTSLVQYMFSSAMFNGTMKIEIVNPEQFPQEKL